MSRGRCIPWLGCGRWTWQSGVAASLLRRWILSAPHFLHREIMLVDALTYSSSLLLSSLDQDLLFCRKKPGSREAEGVSGWFDSLSSSRARVHRFVHCRILTTLFTTALPAHVSISVSISFQSNGKCVNRGSRSLQNRIHAGRCWNFLQRILAHQGM